jgi:hypothetical protein
VIEVDAERPACGSAEVPSSRTSFRSEMDAKSTSRESQPWREGIPAPTAWQSGRNTLKSRTATWQAPAARGQPARRSCGRSGPPAVTHWIAEVRASRSRGRSWPGRVREVPSRPPMLPAGARARSSRAPGRAARRHHHARLVARTISNGRTATHSPGWRMSAPCGVATAEVVGIAPWCLVVGDARRHLIVGAALRDAASLPPPRLPRYGALAGLVVNASARDRAHPLRRLPADMSQAFPYSASACRLAARRSEPSTRAPARLGTPLSAVG